MRGNDLYAAQSTSAAISGAVWRLPLIQDQGAEKIREGLQLPLRNPLLTPITEEEDLRRYAEGCAVAQALQLARQQQGDVNWKWSEVMLLVRRRTHLVSYERALREAGIPFISNRRGGLLDALEIIDLVALLSFLMTPGDNRSLAHILKSPIVGAGDEVLIALAQREETSWWLRLAAMLGDGSTDQVLIRGYGLLSGWMDAAHHLPVHDLLDRIYHEGELPLRYAQAAPPETRAQVTGNLTEFIELALNLDAGRYPSLPKFILALNAFQQAAQDDAPDESAVDANTDAVRILTIHSAKGLEADVVVVLDANHSTSSEDAIGVLCQWPLQSDEQMHFSVYGKKEQRGVARDALFAQEEAQAEQENWNLLYVAATRAKRHLIISGIAAGRTSNLSGAADGSWYQRFEHVEQFSGVAAVTAFATEHCNEFSLEIFAPPCLSLPEAEPFPIPTLEQTEGIALHLLMERISNRVGIWPIVLPGPEAIAEWLPCNLSIAATVRQQAENIVNNSALEKYFNSAKFMTAFNELEIWFQKKLLRLDRVVHFADEIWVLDYKRQYLQMEIAEYEAQLQEYVSALKALDNSKKVRAGLILSDGSLIELA
jgi:ATP-dependent helicase/nuclease subunit A